MQAENPGFGQMGDLAYGYLSNSASALGSHTLTTGLRPLAANLAHILFRVEIKAGSASSWPESGGGGTGQMLVEHGFRLRQLLGEPS